MIRKILIVLLTIAAAATGGLWVWMLSQNSFYVEDLLDIPSSDVTIQYTGSCLVFTELVESFAFPDPLGRRSVIQYDTHDWRGSVSEVHAQPASRVPSLGTLVLHDWVLARKANAGKWFVVDYASAKGNPRSVMVSAWLFIALFGIYPFVACSHGPLRRWRRRKLGLCLKCGYDLTGNVSGVCSECGTSVETR
ncbi:MAG: hypothetical protein IIB60_02525 [Planctomycetes bacterium]|nr:hypothetical protein [Planctomycetota bacterium]